MSHALMRCDVIEDPFVKLSRFRMGLQLEIQELIPHNITTLEEAFRMVQELELYLRDPRPCAPLSSAVVSLGVFESRVLARGLSSKWTIKHF